MSRSELQSYIAASDCIVVPSLSESFGFAAAEACAMGKPIVASNVASLPEVVSARFILIEPGDTGKMLLNNNNGFTSSKEIETEHPFQDYWHICAHSKQEQTRAPAAQRMAEHGRK